MTTKLIFKHLPKYISIVKGRLDQEQKNIRSTKLPEDDTTPKQEPNNSKSHDIICTVIEASSLHKSYSDHTGKFPVKYSSGNHDIFIIYHFDSNSIYAVPIKFRRAEDISKAWQEIFDSFQINGHAQNIHILDSECSFDLKADFKGAIIEFQFPPQRSLKVNMYLQEPPDC